ncbi:MAG: hypothetical protein ACK4N5_01870 [Myxococcales bacterium]
MPMRLLLPLTALLLVACGETTNDQAAPDAGQGDSDGGNAEADAGARELKVHVRGAREREVYVLLGDGAGTPQGRTTQGDITLAADAPQDVTVVDASGAKTTVLTVRAVAPVELTVLWPARPAGAAGTIRGTLEGTTSAGKAWAAGAYFAGGGRARTRSVANDKSFAVTTRNTGEFWLAGYEADGTGALAKPLRAGLVRTGLSLAAGATVTGADVTLTHPFDQAVPVKVANVNEFAFPAFGGGVFYDFPNGGRPVRISYPGLGAFLGGSGTVPAVARTAPFDDCTYGVAVGAQDTDTTSIHLKSGLTSLTQEVEVRPLPFVALTASSPVKHDAVDVRWTAPEVRTAEAMLLVNGPREGLHAGESPVISDAASFAWIVLAPPTGQERSFKPFALPPASGAPERIPGGPGCGQGQLSAGCYQLYVFAVDDATQTWTDVVQGRLDFFQVTARPDVRISIAEAALTVEP